MKKTKASKPAVTEKTIATRIVEKYRHKMNRLTEAERRELLEEGLATIYHAPASPDSTHAHFGQTNKTSLSLAPRTIPP